jgi:hypothetical protein
MSDIIDAPSDSEAHEALVEWALAWVLWRYPDTPQDQAEDAAERLVAAWSDR